ncbi:hypothetical protein X962_5987 [Burkholderia pseudomallei MSHR7343]|nr:hypothetical protein X962_5987 [Burkholderia pseudomallei MSHR7343]
MPFWFDTVPAICTDSGPCELARPPWFDRLPPPSVMPAPLDRLPRSLMTVPLACAFTAPFALTVEPARFTSPAVAVSARLPLAAVALFDRLTPLPVKVALPAALLVPVAVNWPLLVTFRSPLVPTVLSTLMPAPSVPVELRLPTLAVRFCWAVNAPLLVRSAPVVIVTDCLPYVTPLF